jgi:hypothetical protein
MNRTHPYQNWRGKQAAPSISAAGAPVPAIDVFRLRCEARADQVAACLMDFHEAVDGLRAAAIRYGLVKEIGMDAVQAIVAEAFAKVPRADPLIETTSLRSEVLTDDIQTTSSRNEVHIVASTLAAADYLIKQNEQAMLKMSPEIETVFGEQAARATTLGEWDAGDDTELPPPRSWLLGNSFARRFLNSVFAEGGTGKTALRYAQLLSLATGRSLTGEHVFQRCRMLIVSLEDDADELRRRILAAMLHYKIERSEVSGRLFLSAPGAAGGKLMTLGAKGWLKRGVLADNLEAVIADRNIDIVSLDPFVKTHSVEENSNSAIDDVAQVLTDLASKYDIAVDIPHHTRKGSADPGNAERGRGAGATKDAGRLVYTLTTMNTDEARAFGIAEEERRLFVRLDSAKVNIAPPMANAKWFRLVGVPLGNATER